MKITIISGSHRQTSQSGKVARYMAKELEGKGIETFVLDLGQTPLPLWDDGMWKKEGPAYEAWQPLKSELASSDAFIVISAEWNGTSPAALNNFFHYPSMAETGHKPAMIVGVSASLNGAYPVAELRMASTKNCKMVYIPDHIIVRNVVQVLNEDVNPEEHSNEDAYIRERIDYSLDILMEYGKSLRIVRDSGKTQTDKFGFGQ